MNSLTLIKLAPYALGVALLCGVFGYLFGVHVEHNARVAEVATIRAKAAEDLLAATQAARTEGERRYNTQKAIANETIAQRDKAAADLDLATAAGARLQKRLAQLTASLASANHPATGLDIEAATTTTDLLAYLRSRLDEAENGTIRFADSSHIAGAACERSYDALNSGAPPS